MNRIKINSAESIIQAYFDGGESYDTHQKYSDLNQYEVTIPDSVTATVKQGWCAGDILIYSGKEAVTLERACDLDVSGFDQVTLCAHSRNVTVSIILTTDKGEQVALREYAVGQKEFGGRFQGDRLLKIRLEVQLTDPEISGDLGLVWLAVANSQRLPQTQERGYYFSPDWEGCFKDDYEIGPEIGIYFGKDQLAEMRDKVKKPPFDKIYNAIKADVYSKKDFAPEDSIEDYLINENKLMCRPGHFHLSLLEGLQNISFVAMLEEDRELIRLAGRILLSIAVTPHWCESFMGDLPGATWHHRSFLEGLACKRCAIALDFIGSSLSWHGKNLVYDAIMQKGLPRVEADMFTMDYIRHCNQGVVFNDDRIFAYLALAKQYPRYEKMIDIAEADFNDMVEKNVEEDGGSLEGPSYWSYTMDNVVEAAIVLARYRGKSLKEYVSPRLEKMVDYVLAVICQHPQGYSYMLLNDTYGYGRFGGYTLNFIYQVTGNDYVGAAAARALGCSGGLETMVLADKCPDVADVPLPQGLISLNTTGLTTLRQQTGKGKNIQLSIRSGKAYYSHFHEDKGQILLFADDEELLCDRGNAGILSKKPASHNLFIPEREGLPYTQLANDCDGRVLESRYEAGIFTYQTDLTNTWEKGIFEKLTREVTSEMAGQYLLTDTARCIKDTPMSLRFNSIYPIEKQDGSFVVTAPKSRLMITPVNYAMEKFEIKMDGQRVTGEPVYQLIIHFNAEKEHSIQTKLTVQ